MQNEFFSWVSKRHPSLAVPSINTVLKLAEEGATVPFMARYRKEQTGNLDEVQIQQVLDARDLWLEITKRQEHISKEIEKQEKLTNELRKKIFACFELDQLEDIYLPYKLKRKTKATIAKEAGLEPLALSIWEAWSAGTTLSAPMLELAKPLVDKDKKLNSEADVVSGVQDILVEKVSENMELRQFSRDYIWKHAYLISTKGAKAKEPSKFDRYFDYSETLVSLQKPESSHRYLAMRRGWMEEELTLTIGGSPIAEVAFEVKILEHFSQVLAPRGIKAEPEFFDKVLRLSFKGYIFTSLGNEVHKNLKDASDTEAIKVFASNIRQVLMSPPLGSKTVMALDPGIRTGVKAALVDNTGKYLHEGVLFLQNDAQKSQAVLSLLTWVKKFNVEVIAVGNGTAGRETEVWVRKLLKESDFKKIPVIMVNESGASIYSASEVARKEFPELDITVRGAISIGRRLQDPLAELVKLDPKSIGVGQYQHDVSQPALKKSLEAVVDSCVNQVGVNLNTASEYLLARVSGIGPALAKGIIKHRDDKGLFKSRKDLLSVSRLSEKIFEQAAGFIRVPESSNPLDNTGVHPEQYPLLEGYAKSLGLGLSDFVGAEGVAKLKAKSQELQKELGQYSFKDVLSELEKPGRDPRESFDSVEFREDIMEMSDLTVDMICPGVVTNVTNFGAFVDIGVHQDGLVHISQLADHFVKDPNDVVQPGQRVSVKVLAVDVGKRQISLTMKMNESSKSLGMGAPRSAPPAGGRGSSSGGQRSGGKPASRDDFSNNPFAKLAGVNLSKK